MVFKKLAAQIKDIYIYIYMLGIHCIALYMNGNNLIHFDSFRIEYIPKQIKIIIIGSKTITANIYRIQVYDLMM